MKRKIVKKSNRSMKDETAAKIYPIIFWLKKMPYIRWDDFPEQEKELCEAILDFSFSETCKDVDKFCLVYHLEPERFKKWRQDRPLIRGAMESLKDITHVRRRSLWGENKFNKDNFLRYAHIYSDEEDAINKYHSNLRKEENGNVNELIANALRDKAATLAPLEVMKEKLRSEIK